MDLPRDFNEFFKGLFGFPRYPPNQEWRPASDFNNEPDDDQEEHEDHYPRARQDFPNRDGFDFHFSVVTDPLEIHKFFEHQMDEMMRSFTQGFGGLGSGGVPGIGGILGLEDHTENPDHFTKKPSFKSDENEHLDSRSFMLKDDEMAPREPNSSEIAPREPKVDTDLDEEDVSIGDLSKLFSNKDQNKLNQFKPFGQSPWSQFEGKPDEGRSSFFSSFGSSTSQQTIRRADGSIETKSTSRDSQGNETTTIRRRIGEEEHIETIKRGSDGTQVKTDQFVNMDDNGLEDFNSRWNGNQSKQPPSSQDRLQRYSPRNDMISPPADKLYGSLFDKFFGR